MAVRSVSLYNRHHVLCSTEGSEIRITDNHRIHVLAFIRIRVISYIHIRLIHARGDRDLYIKCVLKRCLQLGSLQCSRSYVGCWDHVSSPTPRGSLC